MLEHVTREITVEALPTEIPERIIADVSEMEINDTLQLSVLTIPGGVKLVADDPEEVTIATLSPPRVEEEPEPEVEEEAELVGEEGEAPAEGRAHQSPRARATRRLRRGVAAVTDCFAAGRTPPVSESSSSGSATRASATPGPATTSASRSAPSYRAAGICPAPRAASAA